MTLKQYLDGGYTLPSNIDNFINLQIDDNNYNLREMFEKRNLYKEIGSETQELFKHNLEVLIDEALTEFNPKLKLLNENYKDLMSRTITETVESDTTSGREDKNYLQPANTNATKLTDKNQSDGTIHYEEERKKSFGFVWSNGRLLEEALKIQTIYVQILQYLDKVFIGEY